MSVRNLKSCAPLLSRVELSLWHLGGTLWSDYNTGAQIFREALASRRGSHTSHPCWVQICHCTWAIASPNLKHSGVYFHWCQLYHSWPRRSDSRPAPCHDEASSSPTEVQQQCEENLRALTSRAPVG